LPNVIYCVCQPKKKLGGQAGGQAKIWAGHGPPRPPLESPLATASIYQKILWFVFHLIYVV